LNPEWGVLAFETYLSAEPKATGEDAWVSGTHAGSGRPERSEAPAPEGSLSPDSIRACLRPQVFPKSFRLLRRSEFRQVYDQGQRRSAPLCTVFFRPNGLPQSRLGITVPSRLGKAVLRNRLKRRVREVFRLNRAALPGGWDILVNPREAVIKIPFQTLVRELLQLFPSQPPPAKSVEVR
jgi:ribonuclease P protein component